MPENSVNDIGAESAALVPADSKGEDKNKEETEKQLTINPNLDPAFATQPNGTPVPYYPPYAGYAFSPLTAAQFGYGTGAAAGSAGAAGAASGSNGSGSPGSASATPATPNGFPYARYAPQGMIPIYSADGTYQMIQIPPNHVVDGFGHVMPNPNAKDDNGKEKDDDDKQKQAAVVLPPHFLPPQMMYPYATPFAPFPGSPSAGRGQTPGGAVKPVRPAKPASAAASAKDPTKKFVCPHSQCGRAFARNFNLQSHIKSHLGVREFICPECGKKFSRRHDCMRHCLALHHYTKDTPKKPIRMTHEDPKGQVMVPLPSLSEPSISVLQDSIPVMSETQTES